MSKILWERKRGKEKEMRKCFRWHVKEMTSMDKFCRKEKKRVESHVFLCFRSSQVSRVACRNRKREGKRYIYIYINTHAYITYMNTEMNYITNNVSFNVRRACVEVKKSDRFISRCEIDVSVRTYYPKNWRVHL